MNEKQKAILTILSNKPMKFKELLKAINESFSIHADGLESILHVMTKNKLIVIQNEYWLFNKWPEKKAA